jgi:hypothetical protein
MGMCAQILAVGKFSRDVVPYLEYPEDHYRHTHEGAPVVRFLFGIFEGSSRSREFAQCFGIDDPWDFNQHRVDANKADLKKLYELFSGDETDERRRDVEAFEVFRKKGYEFYFVPNG